MKSLQSSLADIRATRDLLEKALKLSGLVTAVFREAGWDLVVVGGSAVEFYTEGAYMSGDVDFCRRTLRPIPLRTAQDLMGKLEAEGGPRSWQVAGLFVDLLGVVEKEGQTPIRQLQGPYGAVNLIDPEELLVSTPAVALAPVHTSFKKRISRPDELAGAAALARLRRTGQAAIGTQ